MIQNIACGVDYLPQKDAREHAKMILKYTKPMEQKKPYSVSVLDVKIQRNHLPEKLQIILTTIVSINAVFYYISGICANLAFTMYI
jgi:hypothetical protein